MSSNQENLFQILEQVNETSLKIQQNIPDAKAELIEIAQSGPAKSEDGKPGVMFKTTKGRQFARLEDWPPEVLLEVKENQLNKQ